MRARLLKPGFFLNETLAARGPMAMLLFEALWLQADRDGRLEDRPLRIKAQAFPYFDCDVDALLGQLANDGFIMRYSCDAQRFIAITGWAKHQSPHAHEQASAIPSPDSPNAVTATSPPDGGSDTTIGGTSTAMSDMASILDIGIGSGSLSVSLSDPVSSPNCSGNSTDNACACEADLRPVLIESVAEATGFNEFWAKWKRRVAKADAQRAWRKLKPNAELQAKILKDIERFDTCEPQFIPHPATYLNGRRWEDEPLPLARAGPTQISRAQNEMDQRLEALRRL